MPVLYDGQKLIPAPFLSVRRSPVELPDGRVAGQLFTLTVQGSIVAYKGSPNSAGAFWTMSDYPPDEVVPAESRLNAILRKQEALRRLFATDGLLFEVQPLDGAMAMKCRPRVKGVEFAQGNWFDKCDFTISLEADWVEGLADGGLHAGDLRVSRVSEQWDLEPLDEAAGTYRLSHALSATGRRLFADGGGLLDGKQAWEHAREYVLGTLQLGIDPLMMVGSGVVNGFGLQAYNHTRAQSLNESDGTFSASETWTCYDPGSEPPAVHERTIETRYSQGDGRRSTAVNGTVTGLEVRDPVTRAVVSARLTNARAKWQVVSGGLLAAAQAAAGVSLHPDPLSTQVSENDLNGVISYGWQYDDRPSNVIAGSLTESLTVSDAGGTDVFASIGVIGRPLGPILQGMNSTTLKRRTVSLEAQMTPGNQSAPAAKPDTDSLVLSYAPAGATQLFVDTNDISWMPLSGRYSRTTSYSWQ